MNRLVLEGCDVKPLETDAVGCIKSVGKWAALPSYAQLREVNLVELSCGGTMGMAGGPLIRQATNEVMGMISIGLPEAAPEKTMQFAISLADVARFVDRV